MVGNVGRIRRFSAEGLNTQRQTEAEARIAYYATHPEQIERRLRELDEEWDIDRAIELEAAGTVFTGFLLGVTVSKKWFLLSALASAMLVLHNVQGAYPLLPLFRRLGFRTVHEIAQERYALKAIRGDFAQLRREGQESTHTAFQAAQPTGRATEDSISRAI